MLQKTHFFLAMKASCPTVPVFFLPQKQTTGARKDADQDYSQSKRKTTRDYLHHLSLKIALYLHLAICLRQSEPTNIAEEPKNHTL